MRLVTNTSPLILLGKINALPWLSACFTDILAPPAVLAEVGLGAPSFVRLASLSAIGEAFVSGAIGSLHRGELEALVLARESGIGLVALDDRSARRKATELGLQPIGTVGLIVLAHRRGIIDASVAMDRINELVQVHGLYLSRSILEQIRNDLATPR